MRVLIDTTYARRAPHSGTAVYLDRLIEALSSQEDLEVVPVSNGRRGPRGGGGVRSVRNMLTDRWWEEMELPNLALSNGADVIHHPLPATSMRHQGARVVITVHDLAFERLPDMFDRRFRRYAHKAHRDAALAAAAVICVSETTARDVRELWGVPAERIVVAPHGPGQELPAVPRAAEPEHFLYVGDREPRKDLATLLAAHARYRTQVPDPLPLVLAGAGDPVGPERLAELYAGAAALVHPSLYEGFGLTLLEAMAAGTPVIAARAAGAVEVCGDAAVWFDPGSVEQLADAMAAIGGRARRLSEAGLRRASEFSWARSAQAHRAAYSLAQQ
jgi:glycosyltransferase involved in cell wall biosynthesis